jgi:hypothetical protein
MSEVLSSKFSRYPRSHSGGNQSVHHVTNTMTVFGREAETTSDGEKPKQLYASLSLKLLLQSLDLLESIYNTTRMPLCTLRTQLAMQSCIANTGNRRFATNGYMKRRCRHAVREWHYIAFSQRNIQASDQSPH